MPLPYSNHSPIAKRCNPFDSTLYRYHRDRKAMPETEARALMEQQWSPDTSSHSAMLPWARFIAGS